MTILIFTAIVLVNLLDVYTTRLALKAHPTRASEANPLYGKRPSTTRLLAVKALMLGALAWCYRGHWSTPPPNAIVAISVLVFAITAYAAYKNWKIAS